MRRQSQLVDDRTGFYCVQGECICCCLPHAEAPELMNDDTVPFENCWFARQPETEEEVLRAINALHVSCVEAIRYGGKDPGILTELIRRGHRSCCDELAKHGGS